MKERSRNGKRIPQRRDSEGGFTVVELSITIVILGLLLTVATMSYANASSGMKLNGAKSQIEAALYRAKNAARQQNVTYRLIFYTSASPANPNCYEFMYNVKDASGNWSMVPVDESVSGESFYVSGGRTYIRLETGVRITGCSEIPGNAVAIVFRPSGTTMAITGADGSGGATSQTVTLNLACGGVTGSVSINSLGEIVRR